MASSYLASAEEDLICPLCFELFVDPHTPIDLNCPHVFCSKCLEHMIEGGLGAISCPECRKKTKVPEAGLSSMKVNLRIRSLAEKHKKFSEQERSQEILGTCSDHKNQKITLYCITCDTFACKSCLKHPKSSHELLGVEAAKIEVRKQLRCSLALVKRVIAKKEVILQDVYAKEKKFRNNVDEEVQKLNKAIAKVLEHGEAVKKQLDLVGSQQLKPCLAIQKNVQQQMTRLETAMKEASEAASHGNILELIKKRRKLKEILQAKDGQCIKKVVHLETVRFEANQTKVDLGTIVTKRSPINVDKVQQFKQSKDMNVIASGAEGVVLVGSAYHGLVMIFTKQPNGKYRMDKTLSLIPLPEKIEGMACWVGDMTMTLEGKFVITRDGLVEVYSNDCIIERTLYVSPNANEFRFVLISVTVLPNRNVILGDYRRRALIIYDPHLHDVQKIFATKVYPVCLSAIDDTRVIAVDKSENRICIINLQTEEEILSIKCLTTEFGLSFHEPTYSVLVAVSGVPLESGLFKPGFRPNSKKGGKSLLRQYCCRTGRLVSEKEFGNLVKSNFNSFVCINNPGVEGAGSGRIGLHTESVLATVEHDGIKVYTAIEDAKSKNASVLFKNKTDQRHSPNHLPCIVFSMITAFVLVLSIVFSQ